MKSRAVAVRIFDALDLHYPDADTELHYRNAFELLVATILSAQSTDKRVNEVTPALFAKFPDAQALAAADPADIEKAIVSTGFFRQKTKSLQGMANALLESHGGQVPADMDALTKLPGVGRKTANVVLGHALGVPGLPVDRHVLRVAGRLGLTHSDKPEHVEKELTALLPPERWTRASDTLILHGRRICRPTNPLCSRCNARKWCDYFISGGAVIKASPGRSKDRPLRTAKGVVMPSKGVVVHSKGGVVAPSKGVAVPSKGGVVAPSKGVAVPSKGVAVPSKGVVVPSKGVVAPSKGVVAPSKGVVPPSKGVVAPSRRGGSSDPPRSRKIK